MGDGSDVVVIRETEIDVVTGNPPVCAPASPAPPSLAAEVELGSGNDDTLFGEGGNDTLDGGGGGVLGGAGADILRGGDGDDALDARDGALDVSIDCGPSAGSRRRARGAR